MRSDQLLIVRFRFPFSALAIVDWLSPRRFTASTCAEILALIGQLCGVERACPGSDPTAREETRTAALDLRACRRRAQSAPIVETIRTWRMNNTSCPRQAIAYMLGLGAGLTRALHDARTPLDNNATERGLRGMVLGRKNHYGSRSRRGTEVAAFFYRLIKAAKLCGVESKANLLRATHATLAPPAPPRCPTPFCRPDGDSSPAPVRCLAARGRGLTFDRSPAFHVPPSSHAEDSPHCH